MESSSAQQLRDEIARLGPWHHDVEIAPGVRTGARAPEESGRAAPVIMSPSDHLGDVVGEVFPGGLEGRSVLDCACNAGGYLFAAAQMGAGAGFGFDAREHWIRQARFLAQHLPSRDLEFEVLELQGLPALGLDQFDVTLFKGIFYHLPDPVQGLRLAAEHTRELLLVNTAFRPARGDALVLKMESDVEVMSGVDGLAWIPTGPSVLVRILGWCGFAHTRVRYIIDRAPRAGRGESRLELLAAREPGTFAEYDRHDRGRPRQSGRRLLRAGRRA